MPRAAPVSPSDPAPSATALSPLGGATPAGAGGQGFSKRRRIAESAVFRNALASRPKSRGDFFDVHCVPGRPHPGAGTGPEPIPSERCRLGLVVPKRICRSAARRNWIKRLVRESFRREMSAGASLDCVVRLRRALSAVDVAAARSELSAHWRRVTA